MGDNGAQMHLIKSSNSLYFMTRLVFHKSFEAGYQWKRGKGGFDFSLRFKTTGDHAGFKFSLELWGLFFEFSLFDERHWNYAANRFYELGEYERELELPLYDALATLELKNAEGLEYTWGPVIGDVEDDDGTAPTLPPAA
jgi:hypothetical protein